MSSFRNAVKRKTHKERSQPYSRLQLGLLEKHKDYVERSKLAHEKKDKLQKLKVAASFRNPEEYKKAMVHSKLNEKGQHVEEEKPISAKEVFTNQTHNIAYLETMRSQERKCIEKLRQNLHLISTTSATASHKFFVETEDEAKRLENDIEFQKKCQFRTSDLFKKDSINSEDIKEADKETRKSYKELEQRVKRYEELTRIIGNIRTSKNLNQGGERSLVKEAENGRAPIYKWKTVRKR